MLIAVITALILSLFLTSPVFAIANPDSITMYNTSKAFQNIFEDGDLLFVTRYNVEYATEPTEEANVAFSIVLYNASGTTILASRPLNYYQENIISIYLDASQVTSLGITYESNLILKISGNPILFSTLTEGTNVKSYTLSASDWNIGTSLLSDYCLILANILEDDWIADGWTGTLLSTTSNGEQVLNSSGVTVFEDAIPGITYKISGLSYLSSLGATIQSDTVNPLQEEDTTITNKLGITITNAFEGIGNFLGISGDMAAGLWILLFVLSIMSIIFLGSGNSTGAIILSVPIIVMGAYLGAIPMSLLYTIGMFIVAYVFYFIWLRGS
jgi:hypothetical protein